MDPLLAVELEAKSRQQAMGLAMERGDSPVQQFYCGATVLITGGTGFLGKQLIEKLFRACNVGKVYVLVRPKRGKTVEQRLQDLLQDSVFDLVREKKPDFADYIVAVEGDVADLRLGLCDKDWNKLAEEVDIIFHVAATTKFDESLQVATLINVRGTREALALGKACTKLKSFVYVSTAYVNATNSNIENKILERFGPCPIPPDMMISMAEKLDTNKMNSIEAKLFEGYPNTYTFAKALAEDEVRGMAGVIPICVVRPAIVISSYREPSPGWVDMSCAYGASGLILGPATGLIHVFYANASSQYCLVPVDFVNNAIIVAAWATARKTDNTIDIYSVSSARNLFPCSSMISQVRKVGTALPTPSAVWYVCTTYTANKLLFWFLTCMFHYIPGLFLDIGCILLGKPSMFLKLYQKVYKSQLALSYFTSNTWIFDDSNSEHLYKSLTENDKVIFNFDTTSIDHTEYLTLWCIGLKKYLIKDDMKDTNYARKKQFWLRIVHYVVSCLYVYILWKFLTWCMFNVIYLVY